MVDLIDIHNVIIFICVIVFAIVLYLSIKDGFNVPKGVILSITGLYVLLSAFNYWRIKKNEKAKEKIMTQKSLDDFLLI